MLRYSESQNKLGSRSRLKKTLLMLSPAPLWQVNGRPLTSIRTREESEVTYSLCLGEQWPRTPTTQGEGWSEGECGCYPHCTKEDGPRLPGRRGKLEGTVVGSPLSPLGEINDSHLPSRKRSTPGVTISVNPPDVESFISSELRGQQTLIQK